MKLRLPLAILALALAPLAAPLLAASHPLAALLIRDFFSRLCHQDPSRSFMLEGSPVAVCVRCLGIYWGAALAGMLCLGKAPSPAGGCIAAQCARRGHRHASLAWQFAPGSIPAGAAAGNGCGRGAFLAREAIRFFPRG